MRVPLIDGLRGIAALAVVAFHFNTELDMSGPAGWLAQHGNLGVSLFFVLSGFVIALSVADRPISLSFLGRFAARREIRLSPPYVASIFVLMFLGIFGAPFGVNQDVPTVWEFVAHVLYLQDLLGLEPLSDVYWSLCLEVQFYLFFIVLLWALQLCGASVRSRRTPIVMMGTIVGSIACRLLDIGEGSFLQTWYTFALGVMVYWAHAGLIQRRYALEGIGLVLALGYHGPWAVVACLSAGGLMLASYVGRMDWLSNPVSQFFGRISYSLYLTHNIFGWYAMQVALKFVSPWIAAPFGIAVAVGSALAWYWVLEKPSVMLSRKVRMTAEPALPAKAVMS